MPDKAVPESTGAVSAGTASTGAAVEICQIAPTFESLGLVMDLLAEADAFDGFEFGPLVRTLATQIRERLHVCAFSGARLVGYCGVLPVSEASARLWLRDRAALEPAAAGTADAMALTVVAVRDPAVLHPLIRYCRRGFPGMPIFFKRSYAGKRRPARKSTVINCA